MKRTTLRFYVANLEDAAIGVTFIEAASGSNPVNSASQLGDVTNNHFINVIIWILY